MFILTYYWIVEVTNYQLTLSLIRRTTSAPSFGLMVILWVSFTHWHGNEFACFLFPASLHVWRTSKLSQLHWRRFAIRRWNQTFFGLTRLRTRCSVKLKVYSRWQAILDICQTPAKAFTSTAKRPAIFSRPTGFRTLSGRMRPSRQQESYTNVGRKGKCPRKMFPVLHQFGHILPKINYFQLNRFSSWSMASSAIYRFAA